MAFHHTINPSIHLVDIILFHPRQKHVHIKSKQEHRQQRNHIITQSMAYRLVYTCSSKEDKALITNVGSRFLSSSPNSIGSWPSEPSTINL